MTDPSTMDPVALHARHRALIDHAVDEEAAARVLLEMGLNERAAEHAEEALHARLAALTLESTVSR